MKVLSIILVILALAVLGLGLVNAKSAPQEAVAAAIACFLGIMARVAQAAGHHDDLMEINKAILQGKKEANYD